jgi:hypothetical protein
MFINTKEQYIIEPEALDEINLGSIEQEINHELLFELKDLKDGDFARVVFMTKKEYEIVISNINPIIVWRLVKKIKTNSV